MVRCSKLLLLISLFAICGLAWMFVSQRSVGEKLLTELAMPAGLVWIGCTVAIIVSGLQKQRMLFWLSLLGWSAIFFSGNSLCAIKLIGSLERPYLDAQPLEEAPFDAIVVLGGHTAASANGMTRLGWAGDRVMLAIRMQQLGKVHRIFCTGSRIPELDRDGKDQAEMAAEMLVAAGFAADRIETVDGVCTKEEMRNLAGRLKEEARVGLITSAFHMQRAMRLAKSHSLEFVPLPAHMITPAISRPTWTDWIPDADSMQLTRVACKEYLARLVGR